MHIRNVYGKPYWCVLKFGYTVCIMNSINLFPYTIVCRLPYTGCKDTLYALTKFAGNYMRQREFTHL